MTILPWLSSDGKKILAARVLRTFAYGSLSVVLAVYLAALGLDPIQIGAVFTAALVGSAVMTVGWSLVADRYGRRRTAMTMAVLMLLGGLLLAAGQGFAFVLAAVLTGTVSVTNSEVGIFQTIEQAVLPQTAPDSRRTWLFSLYNLVASVALAAGALFAASVGLFRSLGLEGADAYRPLFLLYALVGLAQIALFAWLSDGVERAKVEGERRFIGIHRSAGTVAKLSGLFALDAFAGGLVANALVAYWFVLRWGFDVGQLAGVFSAVSLVQAASFLAAGWLAHRIGLLNTMVFTHLPSNLLLALVPIAPTAPLAVAVLTLRTSMSQMDVPTRQSYVMAIVDPDERTATAGITNVARMAGTAVSPTLTGIAFASAALGAPFVVAGALKIAYDLSMWLTFRAVRPPEEAARAGAGKAASDGVAGRVP
ncbi:MAG: MFS transporter [Chloroflexota bacterium]|nr:MFS transporter [Chloroflexota bacterium]